MAKSKSPLVVLKVNKNISRPCIHAKSKTSKLKSSKNYKKLNVGQGR